MKTLKTFRESHPTQSLCEVLSLIFTILILITVMGCFESQLLDLLTEPETRSETLSDEFDGTALSNPNWHWQNEPGIGRGIEGWKVQDGSLFINAGYNRPVWQHDASNFLYQEVGSDFDVQTELHANYAYKDRNKYVMTGLMIKSPIDNDWVTLKWWGGHNGGGQIQYQTRGNESPHDGLTGYLPYPHITSPDEVDICFRLQRSGDTYTAWYKHPNSEVWEIVGVTEKKLTPPLQLGIYAGVQSGFGKLHVKYHYFREVAPD